MKRQNIMHLVDFLDNNKDKYKTYPSFKWVYDMMEWDPNYKDIFYLIDNSVHIQYSKLLKRSINTNEPEYCEFTIRACSTLNIASRISDGIEELLYTIYEYYPIQNYNELIEQNFFREPTTLILYLNPRSTKRFFPPEPVSKKESEMLARFFVFWAKAVFYYGYNSFYLFISHARSYY